MFLQLRLIAHIICLLKQYGNLSNHISWIKLIQNKGCIITLEKIGPS